MWKGRIIKSNVFYFCRTNEQDILCAEHSGAAYLLLLKVRCMSLISTWKFVEIFKLGI